MCVLRSLSGDSDECSSLRTPGLECISWTSGSQPGLYIRINEGLPWWFRVKNPPARAGDVDGMSGLRRPLMPHSSGAQVPCSRAGEQQLCPCTTTAEARVPRACALHERPLHERPTHCNKGRPPPAPPRETPVHSEDPAQPKINQ